MKHRIIDKSIDELAELLKDSSLSKEYAIGYLTTILGSFIVLLPANHQNEAIVLLKNHAEFLRDKTQQKLQQMMRLFIVFVFIFLIIIGYAFILL